MSKVVNNIVPSCSSTLPWRDERNSISSIYLTDKSIPMNSCISDNKATNAAGEGASWLAELQNSTLPIPHEDQQDSKLSTVHTEAECIMHHKEIDYAHHKHYLQEYHHHHHDHHHHHHHRNQSNDNESESDFSQSAKLSRSSISQNINEEIHQARSRELQSRALWGNLEDEPDIISNGSRPDVNAVIKQPAPHHQHNHHPHHHHHHHHHHNHESTHCRNRFLLSELATEELMKLKLKAPSSEPVVTAVENLPESHGSLTDSDGRKPGIISEFSPDKVTEWQEAWQKLRRRIMDWMNEVVETNDEEQDVDLDSEC